MLELRNVFLRPALFCVLVLGGVYPSGNISTDINNLTTTGVYATADGLQYNCKEKVGTLLVIKTTGSYYAVQLFFGATCLHYRRKTSSTWTRWLKITPEEEESNT